MSGRVRLRSLAKINLDLRVLGKRRDGFHELRTVFQTISLADTIEIDVAQGRTFVDLKSNLSIPGNLVLQAADVVLKTTRARGRIQFHLRKRIPLGGGLGGGSTNAATVLLALPPLLGKPIPFEKLLELATELGSDVPFFLTGGAALGIGRGAEVYPLPDAPAQPGLLITPGIHSSTAEAYRALQREELGEIDPAKLYKFQSVVSGCQPSATNHQPPTTNHRPPAINDFETVVFRGHPQLKSIKGKLLELGAWRAMMTGSGSALFGLFPDRESRDRAAERFRKEFSKDQVHPFTTVNRARYQALWRRQLAMPSGNRTWPPQDRYAR
jgi:4-diphosphocytidyl-2-C-methyl-D-erythritol kinase